MTAARPTVLAATPERVGIPAIGVDAGMDGLGLNDDGVHGGTVVVADDRRPDLARPGGGVHVGGDGHGAAGGEPQIEFPSQLVYGGTEGAELRLITCGGSFDRRAGSYDENLIVWATATGR